MPLDYKLIREIASITFVPIRDVYENKRQVRLYISYVNKAGFTQECGYRATPREILDVLEQLKSEKLIPRKQFEELGNLVRKMEQDMLIPVH